MPAEQISLAGLLDAQERERAERFLHRAEASAFIVAHAAARILLSRYENTAPEAIRYGYASNGKPYLIEPASAPLYFNFARTRGFAVFAFTRCGEIGVDVEEIVDAPLPEIIRRALSPSENSMLLGLDRARAGPAFFALWARKEAMLKARGDGLTVPPAEIDVHDARAIRLRGTLQNQYWLSDFPAAEGYAAALCVERASAQWSPELRLRDLSVSDLPDGASGRGRRP